jgi:hypothetical protein
MKEKKRKMDRFYWCCLELKNSGNYKTIDEIECKCSDIIKINYATDCK